MGKPTDQELEHRFGYHAPSPGKVKTHGAINKLMTGVAKAVRNLVPAGRDLSLALTHLEDVRMRCNAGVACNPEPFPPMRPVTWGGAKRKFQCVKTVEAVRIACIVESPVTDFAVLVSDFANVELTISREEFEKHKPEPGWYWIRYEDGYVSYSPPEAFEVGYTAVEVG